MKTVIEMAREAGIRDCTCNGTLGCLERFAELVRAAAIKEAPDYLMGYADGVHVEREACAKVCEGLTPEWPDQPGIAQAERTTMLDCAKAIRARGQA